MNNAAFWVVWVGCFIVLGESARGNIILTPIDTVVVSEETTMGSLGSVVTGTGAAFAVRSRADQSPAESQVVSFLQFDVSSLTVADVNDPNFEATFRVDQTTKLNTTSNALGVGIGRNAFGAWDSGGSNYPLHDWGFEDESSTVTAADGVILVTNVAASSPPVNDITADVTSIVKGWVEGTNPNNGFVLYYDRNSFQGAGFDNPELLIAGLAADIPEPSTLALSVVALVGIGLMQRRR